MNQIYKKNQKSDVILIFCLLILAFDVLVFLLAIFGYYFTFIKSTNNILPILVTLAAFYALAWVRKIEKFSGYFFNDNSCTNIRLVLIN